MFSFLYFMLSSHVFKICCGNTERMTGKGITIAAIFKCIDTAATRNSRSFASSSSELFTELERKEAFVQLRVGRPMSWKQVRSALLFLQSKKKEASFLVYVIISYPYVVLCCSTLVWNLMKNLKGNGTRCNFKNV